MSRPWEDYGSPRSAGGAGPWTDYAKRAPVPTFTDRMLEGDANADKPLLERGTNAMVLDAGRSVARQVGLTARAGLRGLMMLPNMIGDAVGLRSTEATEGLGDMMYLPRAENATERVSQDVASGMAGGGPLMTLGKLMYNAGGQVVSRVGNLLRSQPALQTASNITGPAAASIVRENEGGPGWELAAGLAGAFAPGAATAGSSEMLRRLARGGEEGRQVVETNLRTFADAGYGTPSVGQATERRVPRFVESVLSKTPGAAGRMTRAAEEGATNLGGTVDEIATGLAPGASATKAGAAIERGIGKFVEGFRVEQNALYDKLDGFIPKDKPVDMTNTANALAALNADIPGAPALSKFFKNATIQAIEGAMKSDTEGFTTRLPYEAMKKLRTLVGQEIENTNLTSSVPRSKWKELYAALSKDLGDAAAEAGPEAQKAYQRANRYTSAGHDRIDTYLDRVAGKDTVEKVFQAAVSPSEIREGASTINAVMRSIPGEDRKIVQAAFLKRLGAAAPGQQDEMGEAFSAERFLSNWNRISPEAKRTLFADSDGQLRDSLDKIAKVAANLREGSRVFANPSGTAPALFAAGGVGAGLMAIATGHPSAAALLGGMALSANAGARLMTSPTFVKWLADTTKKPMGSLPAALNTLTQLAGSMAEPERDAAEEFIQLANRAANTPGGQAK